MQRFEPTLHRALAHDPQGADGLRQPLELDQAEVTVFEQIADQPARALGDHDRIRLGQRLQASGEVRGFADDAPFLGGALPNEITDHDERRLQCRRAP